MVTHLKHNKRGFEGRSPAMLDNTGPSSNGSKTKNKTKTLQGQVYQIYIEVFREAMEALQTIQTLAILLAVHQNDFIRPYCREHYIPHM